MCIYKIGTSEINFIKPTEFTTAGMSPGDLKRRWVPFCICQGVKAGKCHGKAMQNPVTNGCLSGGFPPRRDIHTCHLYIYRLFIVVDIDLQTRSVVTTLHIFTSPSFRLFRITNDSNLFRVETTNQSHSKRVHWKARDNVHEPRLCHNGGSCETTVEPWRTLDFGSPAFVLHTIHWWQGETPRKNTFFNVCWMLIHMDLFSFVGAGLAGGFFPRNLVSFRCARCWHDNLPRWLWSLLGDQNSYRRSRLSSCTGVDRFGVVIWSCFALFVWHVWFFDHTHTRCQYLRWPFLFRKKSGEAGPADGDSHTDQTGIE